MQIRSNFITRNSVRIKSYHNQIRIKGFEFKNKMKCIELDYDSANSISPAGEGNPVYRKDQSISLHWLLWIQFLLLLTKEATKGAEKAPILAAAVDEPIAIFLRIDQNTCKTYRNNFINRFDKTKPSDCLPYSGWKQLRSVHVRRVKCRSWGSYGEHCHKDSTETIPCKRQTDRSKTTSAMIGSRFVELCNVNLLG